MDLQTARLLRLLHRSDGQEMPVCYVAGPMRGYDHYNFPAFESATLTLREAGWFVFSPAENDKERGDVPDPEGRPEAARPLKEYMVLDLAQVCKSDAVFMLPGWGDSKGAALEFNVAEAVDIPCYTYDTGGRIEIIALQDGGQLVSVDHHHLETIFDASGAERVGVLRRPSRISPRMRADVGLCPETTCSTCPDPSYCAELRRDVVRNDDSKATNPKDAVGSSKMPLHLWPQTATIYGSLGLLEGMLKYGRNNWREAGVRYSIYHDAVLRHLTACWEGEWFDPDSELPHLSHALACLAIIVDAHSAGMLVDDRQYRGEHYRETIDGLTFNVERLKEKYADRSPQHYDIRYRRDA